MQPEDPLSGWQTPPFEPTLINNRVYARGAQDNKGQVLGFLQGVKALIEAGEQLPTIKIVIEGQEESGSAAINDLVPVLRSRLQANVMMVSMVTSMPSSICCSLVRRARIHRAGSTFTSWRSLSR